MCLFCEKWNVDWSVYGKFLIVSFKKKILKILFDFEICVVLSMLMLFFVFICISVLLEGVVCVSKLEEDLKFYNFVKEG